MTVILSQQVGNEGKLRVCNATCHNAAKPKCACICGGKYHGIARRQGGYKPKNVEEAESILGNAKALAGLAAAREGLERLEQLDPKEALLDV